MDEQSLATQETAGSLLHAACCRRKDTVILIGNAPSATRVDLNFAKEQAYTIGCNRGLDLFESHAMVFVDRQPYWQYFGRLYTYPGIPILSKTIFDPNVQVRQEPVAPKYDGKYIEIDVTTDGVVRQPTFSWHDRFVSGPSVAIVMLQIAVAAGYKRIGLVGIDLDYTKPEMTHYWGDGRALGAFMPAQPEMERIIRLLSVVHHEACRRGVHMKNLSPVRGIIDSIFGFSDFTEWLKNE